MATVALLSAWPRWAARVAVLAGLGAVAVLALAGVRQEGARYETITVGRGTVEAHVTAIGTLQPRRYVDVGAQVSGQVTRLHVQPGTEVKKGQLLVEIDPSVQQASVDGGRAALAGLRAQLAEQHAQHQLASQQHGRQQRLAQGGATRLEDVEVAQATLASAVARIDHLQAQIAQTQATLKADEARLGYTRIYAPMAGTVTANFSAQYRYTGAALSADLAWLLGAGFAPLVALGLSAKFGLGAVSVYLLSGAVCTLAALRINRLIERRES